MLIAENIKINENDNLKVVLKISKQSYQNINIEELFIKTMNITTKFNFTYKNDNILITLLKATLDKNYLYYLEELLEIIYNLKFIK